MTSSIFVIYTIICIVISIDYYSVQNWIGGVFSTILSGVLLYTAFKEWIHGN